MANREGFLDCGFRFRGIIDNSLERRLFFSNFLESQSALQSIYPPRVLAVVAESARMVYVTSSGSTVEKRSMMRLSIIPDFFWGCVNFVSLFFSVRAENHSGLLYAH